MAKTPKKSQKKRSLASRWRADQPFNELPFLPPAAELETSNFRGQLGGVAAVSDSGCERNG
jgi:hypothetical protein